MSSLPLERLVDEVQSELITFLRSGRIGEAEVVSTLDFTDLNIDEFARLKRIHFCLSEPVCDFIEELPNRIRRIKTSNQRKLVHTRGEVRGKIDWGQTTKLRHSEHYDDRTRFACSSPYVEYDIPENLVLKRLLWIIERTVDRELSNVDYAWRRRRWTDAQIEDYRYLYERNVHINRIRDGEEITPTSRDLVAARSARDPLYREAYRLYDIYRQLQLNRFADSDVEQVIHETLVVPERIPRLFELFCLFKLVRVLDEVYSEATLQVIEPGSKALARIENDAHQIDVYHDKGGKLQFYESHEGIELDEIRYPYFERHLRAVREHEDYLDRFIGKSATKSLYRGRPDIVVEVNDKSSESNLPTKVLIGEIKYADDSEKFSEGLRELLQYRQFARMGSTYLDETEDVNVGGIVITDGAKTAETSGPIRHISAAVLMSKKLEIAHLLEEPISASSRGS